MSSIPLSNGAVIDGENGIVIFPVGDFMTLKFTFEDSNGAQVSHFEWPIDGDDDEAIKKKAVNQAKRIKHIMSKFLAPDTQFPAADSFEKLATIVVSMMKAKKDIKVRLKTVYNYNNFVALPKYVPFIETMDVASSKLKINDIDKMVKEEPDSSAKLAEKAVASLSSGGDNDSLPF